MLLNKVFIKITDKFVQYKFTRQVIIITSAILIFEFMTMILLHYMPPLPLVLAAAIDCLTLLLLLSPVIWMSIRKEAQYQSGRKKARSLLRERDTRFFTLANSGQALIWTAGKDQKADYFNKPWLTFTGHTYKQELKNNWMNRLHPEDLTPFKSLYTKSFEQQKAFNTECRLKHASGEYRWIQIAGTPRYSSDGVFSGFIGHCLDINIRKQSETYREITREILQITNETDDLQLLIERISAVLQKSTDFESVIFRLKNTPDFPYELFGGIKPSYLISNSLNPEEQNINGIKNVCLCRLVINGISHPSVPGFTQGGSWWTNNFSSFRQIEDCPADGICLKQQFIRSENTSIALIPIGNKDKVFGLIQITSDRKERLSDLIIEKLEGIAFQIGAALQHKMDKEVLKEKDKILNRAQQIAHLGSWSLDLRNNRLTWSDEVYRIFGLQPQEFSATYEGFLDAIHPDDRKMVDHAYSSSLTNGQDSYEIEHRIIPKNSEMIRYVREKCEHIKDNQGNVIRSVGMILDITSTKLAEQALQEKERLLRESQTAGNIASYSSDLVNNTWKASDEIYTIFGIDKNYPNTLQAWADCLHPDFREKLLNDLYKSDSTRSYFEHEYKVFRVNDAKEIWVHGLGKFEYDNEQNRIGLVGTIQDITKRKEAELALRQLNEELEERVAGRTAQLQQINEELTKEIKKRKQKERELIKAEEKYRTIADYNYDWETWLNPEGQFIYVSPSCKRITGYSVDEFINDPELFIRIAHPDDREMVEQHYDDAIEGKLNNISFDFRIITRQGNEKWIAHSCYSVYNARGKWLGQRGSNSDITARKNLEAYLVDSQNKLRALTQYMTAITEKERTNIAREIHDELGHMLTALKYDIDNLTNEPELTAETIKTELPVMSGMVESLIDSVRKIATELRPGILDHLGLFPAVEWQINQFRMMTKINCKLDMDNNLDVTFDKNETTTAFRILQEILTNIARHSKAKMVHVSVSYLENEFKMKVTDDGIGFQMSDQIMGNSLGLMGMQERALSIGGEIQLDSRPGKGTTVSFLLLKQ